MIKYKLPGQTGKQLTRLLSQINSALIEIGSNFNGKVVVWTVKEEFIALSDHPITYSGSLDNFDGFTIGVLRDSAPADELKAAGVAIDEISEEKQNAQKLLIGRVDAVLSPRSIFFYHAEQQEPQFDQTRVKILEPPFKVYETYVAFSKKNPDYEQLTADFNRGLRLIKDDGTYAEIVKKHGMVMSEE